MSQQVYILEDKNSGPLKVGISVDVAVRAGQVNKQFGCDAEVVGVLDVADARKTERFIHGMLQDCRIVGEWFEVSDNRRNYLLAYFDAPVKRRPVASRARAAASDIPRTRLKLTLKEFLTAHKISAYQLAQAVEGVGEQTVYSIVRGDRKPSWESLDSITNALCKITTRRVRLEEFVEQVPDELTVKPKAPDGES